MSVSGGPSVSEVKQAEPDGGQQPQQLPTEQQRILVRDEIVRAPVAPFHERQHLGGDEWHKAAAVGLITYVGPPRSQGRSSTH